METPSQVLGPPAGRPDELVLTSDPDSWTIQEGGAGEADMILLPYEDLERIIENRLRHRAYGRAWEIQRLGKTLDQNKEEPRGR